MDHSGIRRTVVRIMKELEAEQNPGSFTLSQGSADALRIEPGNGSEGEVDVQQKHIVSSISARLINTIYPFQLQDCINDRWQLESFSENVDISELDDMRWSEENVVHVSYVNGISGENYSESNRITGLEENVILIRLIWDFSREDRHPFNLQISWSSKYNWRGLMECLEDQMYDFCFKHEGIMLHSHMRHNVIEDNIDMRDDVMDDMLTDSDADEDVIDDMMIAESEVDEVVDDGMRAIEVVNDLPAVTVSEDNGDALLCVICQDLIPRGESAKQLPCNHLYHSHCILEWFKVGISCPICRDESASNYCIQ